MGGKHDDDDAWLANHIATFFHWISARVFYTVIFLPLDMIGCLAQLGYDTVFYFAKH